MQVTPQVTATFFAKNVTVQEKECV